MDFQKLKYFVSVARHMSFTKGANECHVSQTVISRQIANLERELGVVLFIREPHRVSLTPAGDAFFCEALFMLRNYEATIADIKSIHHGAMGSLKIGFGPYEGHFLKNLLPDFSKSYEDIAVNCMLMSYDVLPFRFTRGLLDIAISSKKCANRVGSICDMVDIYPNKWGIAAHIDHPYWQLDEEKQLKLHNQDLIVLEDDFDDEFRNNCIRAKLSIRNFIVTNFYESQLLMLRANQGLGFLPEFCVSELPSDVKWKPMALGNIESGFVVSFMKESSNPCIHTFMNFVRDMYR